MKKFKRKKSIEQLFINKVNKTYQKENSE